MVMVVFIYIVSSKRGIFKLKKSTHTQNRFQTKLKYTKKREACIHAFKYFNNINIGI